MNVGIRSIVGNCGQRLDVTVRSNLAIDFMSFDLITVSEWPWLPWFGSTLVGLEDARFNVG